MIDVMERLPQSHCHFYHDVIQKTIDPMKEWVGLIFVGVLYIVVSYIRELI